MSDNQPETIVVASGDLGIRNAEAVHGRLSAALVAGSRIAVDCSGMTSADLTFVQQIIAARRSAERAGGALRLVAPLPTLLLELVTRAGFLAEDEFFWTGGAA